METSMREVRGLINANHIAAIGCASMLMLCACREGTRPTERQPSRGALVRDTTHASFARSDTVESAGDVINDSSSTPRKERWVTDNNVLALLSAMNSRQSAAADIELESWHLDAVRAFAASMAREDAELQHSIDSLASRLGLTPVAPALAKPWLSVMQAQIDSMRHSRASTLDRAFVQQQIASHQVMSDYIGQLAAVAERPDVRSFLATAAARVSSQLDRARALQTTLIAVDTAARQRKSAP
jgi:predicted outer membrane protein